MEEYEIEILETAVELRNIIETNFTTQPSKELLQNGFTIDFLEGNVFYNHLSLEINPHTRVKQENLYHISKTFALQTEWSIGSSGMPRAKTGLTLRRTTLLWLLLLR